MANKVDLRADPVVIRELKKSKQRPVNREEGYSMAEKIGACAYLECSAKIGKGVREVFDVAIRAAFMPKKSRRELEYKTLQDKLESIKNFKLPEQSTESKKGLSKLQFGT